MAVVCGCGSVCTWRVLYFPSLLPGNLHMFLMGLGLLSAVSSLKVFGEA